MPEQHLHQPACRGLIEARDQEEAFSQSSASFRGRNAAASLKLANG
jgi:hypothetical protein